MVSPYEIKKEICEIGKRMYASGYVMADQGSISVKAGDNEFFVTPAGSAKGFLTPEMIVRVDKNGKKLDGRLDPPADIAVHMAVYKQRSDVAAVIQAYPPTATGYAAANITMDKFTMPEAVKHLGEVPMCDYSASETFVSCVAKHDALILKKHGALTVGASLTKAFFNLETLEFYAKIGLTANQLNSEQEMSCEELEKLIDLRHRFQIPGKHTGCQKCKNLGTANCKCKDNAEDLPGYTGSDLVSTLTHEVLAELSK